MPWVSEYKTSEYENHLNNIFLLVWYWDVRYSKGGLVFRLNLVCYSNSVWLLDNFQPFEYHTSSVFSIQIPSVNIFFENSWRIKSDFVAFSSSIPRCLGLNTIFYLNSKRFYILYKNVIFYKQYSLVPDVTTSWLVKWSPL